jgi:hypothetical protein
MAECTLTRAARGVVVALTVAVAPVGAGAGKNVPPENFKIAFFGDQSMDKAARAVLKLVAAEGAHAVLHLGDFDYEYNPAAWNAQIDKVLGPKFPYFAVAGNHDVKAFYGKKGYQSVMAKRMKSLGIPWKGDLGVRSTHSYQGIFFVLTAPSLFGNGDKVFAPYIRDQLAADESIWSISAWHVLMRKMQVGQKNDESGWGVYEESRRGGAIIATAHEHSYARTHPLSRCATQEVASTESSFRLTRDDPATPEDEGVTFAFHNGLGGHSIRDQERCSPTAPPYGCNGEWASVFTLDQDADYGALFGVFHYNGNPCLAHFYFKDIQGRVIDEFDVRSMEGFCAGCACDLTDDAIVDHADLEVLLSSWGTCPGTCAADMDADGLVGIRDFLSLLEHWGWCVD